MFNDRRTIIGVALETPESPFIASGPAALRISVTRQLYMKFLRMWEEEQSEFLAAVAALSRLTYRQLCALPQIVERARIGDADYITVRVGRLLMAIWGRAPLNTIKITSVAFSPDYDGPEGGGPAAFQNRISVLAMLRKLIPPN